MEFDFDVWNGVSSLHSDSGRQIGENNTGPDLYREPVVTEHKVQNFDGSRQGLPTNVTALKHVLAVWRDTLQYATLLRDRHIERRGLASPRFNLAQGYVYSKIAAAAVAFRVRRRVQPLADGTLAPLETAFFTLGVGPFMVVRSLLEQGDLTPLREEPLSADELYRLADDSGSMVTPAGKACAGSRRMITEFLDVTMNGSHRGPMDSAEARRAFDAIGDWDAFDAYLFASARLELYVKIARAEIATAVLALRRDDAPLYVADDQHIDDVLAASLHFAPGEPAQDIERLARGLEVMYRLVAEAGDGELRGELGETASATPAVAATEMRGICSRRISRVLDVLAARCTRELKAIRAALGWNDAPRVHADALALRCAGPALLTLQRSLAADPRGPLRVRIRPFELARDLPELQRWLTLDYAKFWGLQTASPEKIERLFTEQLARPGYGTHIGEDIDSGAQAFLLETYSVCDDMLARHFPAQPGDMGAHFMMAPVRERRPGYTIGMLRLCHRYMFESLGALRVIGEPDARNVAMVRRIWQLGGRLGPFLHLPSKVARSTVLERASFQQRLREPLPSPPPLRLHRAATVGHVFLRRVRYKLRELLGRPHPT